MYLNCIIKCLQKKIIKNIINMTKTTNDKKEVQQLEQFEVIFLDEDKVTVLDRQMVKEGD